MTRLNSDRFQVLDRYERVAPFIQAASEASDDNRDLLGFLPRGLFDEYARRNDLFVLAAMDGADFKYAGHLLFDRKHPRAKILPTRVIDPADPLGIIRTPTTEVPLFLIDLNVLFDLSPPAKTARGGDSAVQGRAGRFL